MLHWREKSPYFSCQLTGCDPFLSLVPARTNPEHWQRLSRGVRNLEVMFSDSIHNDGQQLLQYYVLSKLKKLRELHFSLHYEIVTQFQ